MYLKLYFTHNSNEEGNTLVLTEVIHKLQSLVYHRRDRNIFFKLKRLRRKYAPDRTRYALVILLVK